MKRTKTLLTLLLALAAVPALAAPKDDAKAALTDIQNTLGFVPGFLRALPDATLPGTWAEMKGLQLNDNTALPAKYKELIGLAVAAQIPCAYCITAHTEFAKADGANRDELGLAVSEAALTRHWSTFFNGAQLDETKFKAEIADMAGRMKKMDPNAEPLAFAKVTDADSAYKDAERVLGATPEFLKQFPADAVAGAWTAWRDVELNPNGAIPQKYLSLVSLAVAAQIPCSYCIVADTEFAKAAGASDAEIKEAIAMSAFTRHMSTLLNGLQVNEAKFKSDIARLTRKPKVATRH